MATLHPERVDLGSVAAELLDIVGSDRAAEVETVTYPTFGFQVPDDVAVEYERRFSAASQPKPAESPAPEEPAVKTMARRGRATKAKEAGK